jgi:hypothetical protein
MKTDEGKSQLIVERTLGTRPVEPFEAIEAKVWRYPRTSRTVWNLLVTCGDWAVWGAVYRTRAAAVAELSTLTIDQISPCMLYLCNNTDADAQHVHDPALNR